MTKAYIFLFLALMLTMALFLHAGKKASDFNKNFNKNVFINYYGGIGCCETDSGCASGRAVTEDYCLKELIGHWNPQKICNTQTGNCE